jgi:hypothetical protein
MATSSKNTLYRDLKNNVYSLSDLDDEAKKLISEFHELAATGIDWGDYSNAWMPRASELLSKEGLNRPQIVKHDLWKILQDIGSRLHIASGLARAPDYRDELAELIRDKFRTRREFCQVTGLSEDLLSHVLSHRKHLSMDTLADALAKVGYGIHLAPLPNAANF